MFFSFLLLPEFAIVLRLNCLHGCLLIKKNYCQRTYWKEFPMFVHSQKSSVVTHVGTCSHSCMEHQQDVGEWGIIKSHEAY